MVKCWSKLWERQMEKLLGTASSDSRVSAYQFDNTSLIPSRGNFFCAVAEKSVTSTFWITLANGTPSIRKTRTQILPEQKEWLFPDQIGQITSVPLLYNSNSSNLMTPYSTSESWSQCWRPMSTGQEKRLTRKVPIRGVRERGHQDGGIKKYRN